MAHSQTMAELKTERARIHVYTYRYARPSSYTRSPERDVLAFFPRPARGATGYFRTDDRTSRMLPIGGMIIIPAGTSISAIGPGGDRRLAVCTMPQGFLPPAFDRADPRNLAMCSDVRDPHIWACMQRLTAEATSPGFAADLLVDGLTNALQIDIRRYFEAVARRECARSGVLAPWQLKRIEEYVHGADGRRIRIADLAAVAEISPGHLIRTFKKTTGMTVHEFVEQARLERARILLGESSLPLKQIAARLGFGSPSSFSLAFRRATGITPGRFRREGLSIG